MQKFVEICDRCGVEIISDTPARKLITVWIGRSDKRQHSVFSPGLLVFPAAVDRAGKSISAEWCEECCARVGICGKDEKSETQAKPVNVTIEDMLRELVREEIKDAHS